MTRNSRTTSRLAALVVGVLAVAACGGGSDGRNTAATTATASSTSVAPGTTAAPTSTDSTAPPTTGEAPGTTTPGTTPTGPVYPLTGLPVTDSAAAARPALVVKIDNNAAARPQNGLNEADIVFEEIVEIQTRFAIVLQSQGSDPVGPIRSGRTQDIALLGSFNHPLFTWSGGNARVTDAISASDMVNLSAQIGSVYRSGGFYRSNDKAVPHNLYAQSSALWSLAPAGSAPPPQQFTYLQPGRQPSGESSSGVDLDMDTLKVGWTWDAGKGAYLRTSDGKPHNDAVSGQVSASNVIVMTVEYRPSPADVRSPEAQTLGSGEVLVFTGGKVIRGTWQRADRLQPISLKDASGAVIPLTPGRTWVELAKAGTFSPRT